jgi:hypothetical protein
MNVPSVAICINVALEPHAKNFICPEVASCRNDFWAQGYPPLLEGEVIESVPHDLYIERDSVDQRRNTVELSPLEAL